ncbi:MAG: thymidine phosphorylase [Clostridiales bacterium]|nr:thymidine phosphorylase [Clostridiales bacterium]
MNFVDLIIKKRDKNSLTSEEINYFVKRASDKNFPDYQISAMLMAIYLNGLNYKETSDLTMAMANSGKILDLSQIKGIKVDKHSTGGVADTTTLVLAPLVASCGLPVVKMSGRGLGHTGGTVDKLEAISGFNTEVSEETAVELVKKQNIVIMGQSEDLAPADKRFYAMRDVTGTVESIPLIASSIMSKKIAAGCDALVLDVKCGNGSFMKDFSSAEKLAETMVEIGENINKKVIAIITDMNEPLGKHIGNSLEVIEAIEILKGNISGRLKEVSLELGSLMLILGNICETKEEARTLLEENIKNQKGLKKFKELIVSQKGNPEIIDDYSLFPKCKFKKELTSEFSGYISDMDTYNIGKAACEAGAGRKTKTDKIDYGAGIILKFSLGDKIKKGDILAEIHSSSEERLKNAENILKSCIKISENPLKSKKTILKIIGG